MMRQKRDEDLTEDQRDLLRTSLHPLRGRIACITVMMGHEDLPRTVHAWESGSSTIRDWDATETRMLDELRTILAEGGVTHRSPGIIVGHNVKGFDLQWLYVRMLRANHPLLQWLPWPIIGDKPWSGGADDRVHDTCEWLRGPLRQGQRLRLTETLAYLGMVPEDEDSGSGADVAAQWLRGDFHLIEEHCEVDVWRVMKLHSRLVHPQRRPRGPFIGLDIETIPDPTHPLFTLDLLEESCE